MRRFDLDFSMMGWMLCLLLGHVAAPAAAATNVTMHHYDIGRTGWNSTETILTPTTVGSSRFGVIAKVAVDGQVDAQPLLMSGQAITAGPKKGTYDVVYLATESNTIYAINANTGEVLLTRNFGAPVPAPLGCLNNGPNVGINGTPVVAPDLGTLNFITYTKTTSGSPTFVLHAVRLNDLSDYVAPVTIAAQHQLSNGTTYTFNPTVQRQRAALAYSSRRIYAAFGSFCDFQANKSRGWLLGWDAGTLKPLASSQLNNTLSSSPNSYFLSSIWMSGAGPAIDPSNNVFVVTGNSDYSGTTYDKVRNVSESLMKVSPDLSYLYGVFTPANFASLDQKDLEFGSGGLVIVPPQGTAGKRVIAAAGKDGNLYLIDRAGFPPYSVQPFLIGTQSIGACWCQPTYFTGSDGIGRIVSSGGSSIWVWKIQLLPTTKLVRENTQAANITTGQDGGFFTVVSSNGTQSGSAVIWAVGKPTGAPFSVNLYAFSAKTGSNGSLPQLFSGPAGTWPFGDANANIVPVVANGKVYVASDKTLTIFGLR